MNMTGRCPECLELDGDCTCTPKSQRPNAADDQNDDEDYDPPCPLCGEVVCDGLCDEVEF